MQVIEIRLCSILTFCTFTIMIGSVEVNKKKLYSAVVQRILQLRKYQPNGEERAQKITQEGLAELVGVPRTTITNIENGRQMPSLHLLYNICSALEVELTDLLPPISGVTSGEARSESVIVAGTDLQDELEEKLVAKVKKALRK